MGPCGSERLGNGQCGGIGSVVGSIGVGLGRLRCRGLLRGGRVGRHRDFRVALVGLGRLGFGLVDELAVDLDPTDEQQAGLEAHPLLAGTLALGVGEGVGPQVAQAEADHHLLLGVDRLNAAAHQVLRFRTRYARVETHIRDVIAGTVQSRDVAGQERIAFLGLHFADAIEIPEAGNMQVEVGLFGGSGHGESPEEQRGGDTPDPGGEGVEPPRGLMEQLRGIAIGNRWTFAHGCRCELE
ncbi:hypothetical protein SDC9_121311 [bioreactor metagenome]|uniref:Uncharacterized protein n=1 Tax=bioreactor metagenome TaxID=1076179 RepID=A0A645CBM0_9ZZZZ